MFQYSSDKKLWVVIGLSILAFILSILIIQEPVLMAADSGGYLGFGIQRPCGYPLFLYAFKTLFGSFTALSYVQLAFYYGALAYLTMSLACLTKKWAYLLLIFLGLLINYPFIKMAFFILPESVSISFLMLTLGAFIRFFATKHIKYLMWGVVCISLGLLCKPVFKFMLAIPLVMIILFFKEYFTFNNMAKIYAPALILWGLGSEFQYYKNGFWGTESFLGHNLLGKVGLIAKQDTPSTMPHFMAPFVEESLKVQKLLEPALWKTTFTLSCPLYDHMRYPILGKITTEKRLSLTDADYQKVAVEIIKGNPMGYLQDIWLNYVGAWALLELRTKSENNQLYTFLEEHRADVPPAIFTYFQEFRFFKRYYGDAIAYIIRVGFALAFFLSLYFGLGGIYKSIKNKPLSGAEISGCMAAGVVQGGYLVICLVQAALPRYTLLFWPCIILLLVLGFREFILKVYPDYEKT